MLLSFNIVPGVHVQHSKKWHCDSYCNFCRKNYIVSRAHNTILSAKLFGKWPMADWYFELW